MIPKSVQAHRAADNFDVVDFPLAADEAIALDSKVRGGGLAPDVAEGSVS
ncbi:hypothetical protein [Streptomyces curacoi]|nr:hypothetical protein [Streptomyces curacoi]